VASIVDGNGDVNAFFAGVRGAARLSWSLAPTADATVGPRRGIM
jgi:hypothetical protein